MGAWHNTVSSITGDEVGVVPVPTLILMALQSLNRVQTATILHKAGERVGTTPCFLKPSLLMVDDANRNNDDTNNSGEQQ